MTKTCLHCGCSYSQKINLITQKFCSKACKNEYYYRIKRKIKDRNSLITKKCEWCSSEFTVNYAKYFKRYCSNNCARSNWRKLNPEKDHAQAVRDRESVHNNPQRLSLLRAKSKIRNQTPKQKYRHYRAGAKSRNFSFELSFKQFMDYWQKPCHYCGSKIETIGIDRLHNNLGYTIENSVSCCETCNKMKMILPLDTFISQCKKIVNHMTTAKA